MKKIILLFLLVINITVFAQNLSNPNFETWTNMGAYEDPDNWITFNMFSAFSPTYPIGVNKTTDSYSGTYACVLETKLDESDTSIVPALLLSGSGDIFSGLSYVPNTVRPSMVSFYYKYLPVNGDTSIMSISLTKWDSGSNSQVQIGGGAISFTELGANFALSQVPIEYFSSEIPDTLLVGFATSTGDVPQLGTQLIVDDITFSMSNVNVSDLNLVASSVYPNPAKDELEFKIDNVKPTEVVLIDVSGKEVATYALNFPLYKINVSDLRQGSYIYQLKENGKIVSKGKINVIK